MAPIRQVMRLSRNRNWGHPTLIAFMEKFAAKAARASGWPGILIGDISQPRGGPMLTGHASHQIGLDADLRLRPMPDRELSREEREELPSTDVVREDQLDVRADVWTQGHFALIRAAALEPKVQRIFVDAAIKRASVPRSGGRAVDAQSTDRCGVIIIIFISAFFAQMAQLAGIKIQRPLGMDATRP